MDNSVPSTRAGDVYQSVTDKIIVAIEAGAGDFVLPWHRVGRGIGRPINAETARSYQGVNVVALWAASALSGFTSGYWATFLQWSRLAARVKRGERSTLIVLFKPVEDEEEEKAAEDTHSARMVARAYHVFNAEQVDGWEPPVPITPPNLAERLALVDRFIAATSATIRCGGDMAYYDVREDAVQIPEPARFNGATAEEATSAFYATLLHELTHWSGAERRLSRTFGTRFGDDAYAVEELVAELGAAFLCADLGISNEPRPDHASYISAWLRVLKADRRAIFTAAQRAREAAAFLSAFSEPR